MRIDETPGAIAKEHKLKGIGVSPGIAIGPAYVGDRGELPVSESRIDKGDIENERARFGEAVALSAKQEVGVDIEAVLPVPEADEIAALCLSASEYGSYTALGPEDRLEGFLRRWTRLEAIS